MGVRAGIGIVPLHWERHADDAPLLRQQVEVAIDCAQTEAGILRLQPVIDHLGGGMLVGTHQGLVDQLPLSGIAFSTHSAFSNNQELLLLLLFHYISSHLI